MTNNIRGIIFDMDGVLVDSEPLHFRAYKELIAEHGGEFTEEYNSQFLGKKDIEIAPEVIEKFALPHSPESFVQEKDEIFHDLIRNEAKPMPGVLDTLAEAKSLELAVALASSSKLSTINLIVSCLEIGSYFSNLTSGEEVPNGKPAPDVFLLSAKRLKKEPVQCLVIEDTDNGVKAAKSAGMLCVAIPCQATSHQEHKDADLKLNSMTDLNLERFC